MNILVTGGAAVIGFHVATRVLERGVGVGGRDGVNE